MLKVMEKVHLCLDNDRSTACCDKKVLSFSLLDPLLDRPFLCGEVWANYSHALPL